MSDGIIGRRAVADSHQNSSFIDLQVRGVFSKIIPARRLNAIALMAVKIGIAVKFHNIGLGIHLFHFRSQQNLHHLPGKGLFSGEISVFNDLLGDRASALSNGAPVFDEGKACPDRGDPVHSGVSLKAPVLLSNVSILEVQADIRDIRIFVVAGVD